MSMYIAEMERSPLVQVYRNLHNGSWSIRSVESGLIVAHAQSVVLDNATFKVSEVGRNRVLKEKRKNVHAVVQGSLWAWNGESFKGRRLGRQRPPEFFQSLEVDRFLEEVSYNPYRFPYFFDVKTLDPVDKTVYAYFTANKKLYRGDRV